VIISDHPGTVWRPSPNDIDNANVTHFMNWLKDQRGITHATWNDLWEWSVDDLDEFWSAVWDYYGVAATRRPDHIVNGDAMPHTRWFIGAQLNYAHNVLAAAPRTRPALIEITEDAAPREWSAAELAGKVGALSRRLLEIGVMPGDRVAAYLPNTAEAVIGLLATTAIGAVWASCGPEYGVRAVTDRFGQISPKILLAVDGYRFGGRTHERGDVVHELRRRLPSLAATIVVRKLHPDAPAPDDALAFDEIVATPSAPTFTSVPAEHPLWILFSSGSTGLPKGIVHGHGGIVLEHLKSLGLCLNIGPSDTMFFVSSTSWMAWNYSLGALLHGATVVLSSANPTQPASDGAFAVAAETHATILGVGSAYITTLAKQHAEPQNRHDLSSLRLIIPTGSPLPPIGWDWLAHRLPARIDSICGATEVCTVFFCGNPHTPVRSGQISGRSLGVNAQSWDAHGRPQLDTVGEMMVTTPMPSMPLRLWNDPTGERYRGTYFDKHPTVWRQGDWIRITEHGGVEVKGRSDATLNRGGVRLGSAEIYTVVDQFDEIRDSLVIGAELKDGGYLLALFVVMADGAALDDALRRRITARLRAELSPRHVPDTIAAVPAVPRTLTGKKLEIPVKAILQGAEPSAVAAPEAADHPQALRWFAQWAADNGTSA
jgi:acetoacetyl-CoA synthetase